MKVIPLEQALDEADRFLADDDAVPDHPDR